MCVNKPPGMSSHDVVAWARRLFGIRKIGHTGTLDPGAAGVLVLAVGAATKVLEFMEGDSKAYRAECTLGVASDSQDKSGQIVSVTSCAPSTEAIKEALRSLTGRIQQIPPMTSAVKHQGKRLYELARQGKEVERKPREVVISSLQLRDARPGVTVQQVSLSTLVEEFTPANRTDSVPTGAGARLMLDIACSRGTYVRTLCHDLGRILGCGAYMSFLLRTASGGFTLEHSRTLQEWESLVDRFGPTLEALQGYVQPISSALRHMPRYQVTEIQRERAIHGNTVEIGPRFTDHGASTQMPWLLVDGSGEEICVAYLRSSDADDLVFQPTKVLAQ